MRVILAAFALSALSFVVGLAGDLSSKPANSGVTVTLRIPPPIPADAPRAAPLPLRTPSAEAATPVDNFEPDAKPPSDRAQRPPKADARLDAKAERRKGA